MKYLKTFELFESQLYEKDKFTPPKELTKKELEHRWKKKRTAIKILKNNISKLKRQVTSDLNSKDEKTQLIATVIKIIEMTGERVGNENSSLNGHHGITNFQNKHIKISGNNITLKYMGKSGVDHNVIIRNSTIANILKKLKRKNKDNIFITSDGSKIHPTQVNNYLSKFDITSKDLRGFKANKLMREKLSKLKKTKDDKEIKKNFNEILRQVAEIIGHGAATLRKHYLLPEIEENYYKYGSVGYVKSI